MLIDVIVTLFLLATAGLIFSATFPASFACSDQARQYKIATAIAQRKMEQLRATKYESLTAPLLTSSGIIDTTPTSSPYSITAVDSIADQLPGGEGSLSITNETGFRKVQITVTWTSAIAPTNRSIRLTTVFADRRPRQVN